MEILGLSIKTDSEAHNLLVSRSTSRIRIGGSEEALIEQLMGMDSTSIANLADKAEDMLSAIRRSWSRLRKLN
ncbi:hypothetical protein BPAE_0519g00030 [Botrytis paeoniae]|uniref:Uncharacterized protein n=1 Tax=Botrytis paeoniae TaxID=278948 RepID=A0A4Z1EY74_9HELO|nr:hypothetical protein BPAE_0519g00030 [Botrytis paeoniae]